MFRRPSKRQLLIRRIIVYIITTLSVLVIVTGAILFILGYRIDSNNRRLEQGALLQFESTPASANVSIDGKVISSRTATKQSVMAGWHSFVVSKNGYHSWVKSLELKAGTLTWLDYIRLVPTTLPVEGVATYDTVYGEKASPDLRSLIVQQKPETPSFQLVDLRAQEIKSTTLTLSPETYSDATTPDVTHTFTLDRWDAGGRYILLKHAYNDKSEWIVLDTQDVSRSRNVSISLGITVSDLRFSGTSGNVLYGLMNDGVIRKLDLSADTISRALVTNVKNFNLFETNIITYVGIDPKNSAQQVVGIYREGDEAAHVLRTVTSLDTKLSVDAASYFSDDYVVVAEGAKVTILKGDYPTSSAADSSSLKTFAEFTASAPVDTLTFGPDGNYVVAQSGLSIVSYEIEHLRQTSATIETSEKSAHTLNWLDSAYVWAVYDGHLSIREFDGSNVHVISATEPNFDATLSQNGRFIYSIGKSGDKYQLQRVKMIID